MNFNGDLRAWVIRNRKNGMPVNAIAQHTGYTHAEVEKICLCCHLEGARAILTPEDVYLRTTKHGHDKCKLPLRVVVDGETIGSVVDIDVRAGSIHLVIR